MGNANRVKASAGAEWLLGGFGLLKKAPLALGLVGLVFAAISLVLPIVAGRLASMLGPLLPQLVVVLLVLAVLSPIPVFIGGLIHAVREVAQDRSSHVAHLLQGYRDGKSLALMAQILLQFLTVMVVIVLLVLMVGPTTYQNLMLALESSQGQNLDPALFEDFPVGTFFLWLLTAILAGLLVHAFTFLFPAQVMFEGTRPFEAMKRSFRTCMANLGAFLVFIVLFMLVAIGITLAAQIVGMIIGILAGQIAASIVAQLLIMTVLMPVFVGAAYFAWLQLLGSQTTSGTVQPPATGIEL